MRQEFKEACETDHWSGYTELHDMSVTLEIRHPRPPISCDYSLWRWSTLTGWVLISSHETHAQALIAAENYVR